MRQTYTEMRNQTKAARWSEYYSCLNSVAAQQAANDSHVMADSSIQQLAAVIEPQRAHVVLKIRGPEQTDQYPDRELALVYSMKNYGKSETPLIKFSVKAVLLESGDTLSITEDRESTYTVGALQPDGQYPETPDPPYRASTPFFFVVDTKGKEVDKNSLEAQRFVQGLSGVVAVIAQITYSDFAGTHTDRFCTISAILRPGTTKHFERDPNLLLARSTTRKATYIRRSKLHH